ncbi:hypothetical protein PPERSA_01294 [Pseudocohnilembus persalinus]|uniref:Uncharacterized protein n=1 Tax=Pseudocohnilembus persalinus TaxID=266149 RepID=A0A0V0QGR4_PSEPJ|nr:hypothetical protein PPERSA_01294 [Pseudocohnilembus persalinus]|eukprot:KRX01391.1 hypothetical protein PPERSA_01294 [Pseudocohnilembus persalinus]
MGLDQLQNISIESKDNDIYHIMKQETNPKPSSTWRQGEKCNSLQRLQKNVYTVQSDTSIRASSVDIKKQQASNQMYERMNTDRNLIENEKKQYFSKNRKNDNLAPKITQVSHPRPPLQQKQQPKINQFDDQNIKRVMSENNVEFKSNFNTQQNILANQLSDIEIRYKTESLIQNQMQEQQKTQKIVSQTQFIDNQNHGKNYKFFDDFKFEFTSPRQNISNLQAQPLKNKNFQKKQRKESYSKNQQQQQKKNTNFNGNNQGNLQACQKQNTNQQQTNRNKTQNYKNYYQQYNQNKKSINYKKPSYLKTVKSKISDEVKKDKMAYQAFRQSLQNQNQIQIQNQNQNQNQNQILNLNTNQENFHFQMDEQQQEENYNQNININQYDNDINFKTQTEYDEQSTEFQQQNYNSLDARENNQPYNFQKINQNSNQEQQQLNNQQIENQEQQYLQHSQNSSEYNFSSTYVNNINIENKGNLNESNENSYNNQQNNYYMYEKNQQNQIQNDYLEIPQDKFRKKSDSINEESEQKNNNNICSLQHYNQKKLEIDNYFNEEFEEQQQQQYQQIEECNQDYQRMEENKKDTIQSQNNQHINNQNYFDFYSQNNNLQQSKELEYSQSQLYSTRNRGDEEIFLHQQQLKQQSYSNNNQQKKYQEQELNNDNQVFDIDQQGQEQHEQQNQQNFDNQFQNLDSSNTSINFQEDVKNIENQQKQYLNDIYSNNLNSNEFNQNLLIDGDINVNASRNDFSGTDTSFSASINIQNSQLSLNTSEKINFQEQTTPHLQNHCKEQNIREIANSFLNSPFIKQNLFGPEFGAKNTGQFAQKSERDNISEIIEQKSDLNDVQKDPQQVLTDNINKINQQLEHQQLSCDQKYSYQNKENINKFNNPKTMLLPLQQPQQKINNLTQNKENQQIQNINQYEKKEQSQAQEIKLQFNQIQQQQISSTDKKLIDISSFEPKTPNNLYQNNKNPVNILNSENQGINSHSQKGIKINDPQQIQLQQQNYYQQQIQYQQYKISEQKKLSKNLNQQQQQLHQTRTEDLEEVGDLQSSFNSSNFSMFNPNEEMKGFFHKEFFAQSESNNKFNLQDISRDSNFMQSFMQSQQKYNKHLKFSQDQFYKNNNAQQQMQQNPNKNKNINNNYLINKNDSNNQNNLDLSHNLSNNKFVGVSPK